MQKERNHLIKCLECGKEYKSLSGHLKIHGLTAHDYKEKHNLPFRKGLICESTFEKLSALAFNNIKLGVLDVNRAGLAAKERAKRGRTEDEIQADKIKMRRAINASLRARKIRVPIPTKANCFVCSIEINSFRHVGKKKLLCLDCKKTRLKETQARWRKKNRIKND